GARHPERARHRGPVRLGGDDPRHVRGAVGVGRRRARADLRLAAREQGRRGEGLPDRQPRLLDRGAAAVDSGRDHPPAPARPDPARGDARRPRARAVGSPARGRRSALSEALPAARRVDTPGLGAMMAPMRRIALALAGLLVVAGGYWLWWAPD